MVCSRSRNIYVQIGLTTGATASINPFALFDCREIFQDPILKVSRKRIVKATDCTFNCFIWNARPVSAEILSEFLHHLLFTVFHFQLILGRHIASETALREDCAKALRNSRRNFRRIKRHVSRNYLPHSNYKSVCGSISVRLTTKEKWQWQRINTCA